MACSHQLPDGSCPTCMSDTCLAEVLGGSQEDCDAYDEDYQ